MLKKSDIVPLILAFLSTVLILSVGAILFAIANINKSDTKDSVGEDRTLRITSNRNNLDNQLSLTSIEEPTEFVLPAIVPQGISVEINGSTEMNQINQSLRKSFHRRFPGTIVTTNAEGIEKGIKQLTSGDIDIAAINRPLSDAEKNPNIAIVKISQLTDNSNDPASRDLYYAYRIPVKPGVEAFLGYVLSEKGQQAILEQ